MSENVVELDIGKIAKQQDELAAIIQDLSSKIDNLTNAVDMNNRLVAKLYNAATNVSETNRVYTDAELYRLKQELSWKALSNRTGIKVSTLQYRYRKYSKQLLST